MAGTLKVDAVQSSATGAAPTFKDLGGNETGQLCRAWVNFNGTTGTVRASFNVSSVTRASTGLYTVNFTNTLSDANYSAVVVPDDSGTINPVIAGGYLSSTRTTSAYAIQCVQRGASSAVLFDSPIVSVAVFR